MAYCTTPQVLERMAHSGATSTDLQSRIDDAIPAADEQIDSDTGRTAGFEPVTGAVEVFGVIDLDCGNVLRLDRFTFVTVTELALDDDDDGTFETVVGSSGYELGKSTHRAGWPYDSIRLLDRSFPSGGRREGRIRITGTAGFAATPRGINQASSLLSARIAQRITEALFGTQTFNDLGAASIRSNDPDYLRLIGPYRIPAVA